MSSGTPFNYTRTVCSGERKEAMAPLPETSGRSLLSLVPSRPFFFPMMEMKRIPL